MEGTPRSVPGRNVLLRTREHDPRQATGARLRISSGVDAATLRTVLNALRA
jgi:hypothetical protein